MENFIPLFTETRGEIGQRDFWIGAAVLFAAGLVANLIPFVGTFVALALLYPWTCLALKRLRDAGRPASLAVVPLLLGLFSIAGSLLAVAALTLSAALAGLLLSAGGVAGLLALAFIVWLGLTPSRHGPSRGDTSNLTSRM